MKLTPEIKVIRKFSLELEDFQVKKCLGLFAGGMEVLID